MKSSVAAIMLCLAGNMLMAQEYFTITGSITDTDQQSIASGDVVLLHPADSTVMKHADILNGSFQLSNVRKGNYLLRITSLGYAEQLEKVDVNINTSVNIQLKRSAALLGEVTVTASKPPYTFKNGNITLNLENSVLSAVRDPVELLSKLPTVQVSSDGETISVVGKGQPLIYIDNIRMSMNDLKSLDVSDIKTIELVTNPSSKYEAEGRSVLLITRKINRKEGVKGELAQTAAYRKYYLNRASANISVKKKKVELKGSFQYNHLETWEGNAFDFDITNRNISSGYSVTAVTTRPQFIAGTGLYYQLNGDDYISLNTTTRKQNEFFPIYTYSTLQEPVRSESVFTDNDNFQPEFYHTSNLNFNKKFTKHSSNLFAGVQYTRFTEDTRSTILNSFNNNSPVLSEIRIRDSEIGVIASRIDFEKTFKNGYKWETGASATTAFSAGSASINSYSPPSETNTSYDYREKYYAIYSQLSGKWKKMDITAGLRSEGTHVKSEFDNSGTPSSLAKSSTKIFPKGSVSIPLDSSSSVSIKYAKSITRPEYSNANQVSIYINPYFRWANNVNLNPSILQELTAAYQYRNYSAMLVLYQTRGPMYDIFEYDDAATLLTRVESNFDSETGIYLSLTIPFKYKLWSSTNVMNIIRSSIKDPSAQWDKPTPYVYAYSNNEFKLPRNYTFSISAWGVTKRSVGVFERNMLYSVDTSLTKQFKNFTCSMRFNNMFASINGREKFTVNDVTANGIFYDNSRELSFSLRYTFGKLKESSFKNRDVDDSGNRVK